MPINLEQEALTDLLTQTRETTVCGLARLDLTRPLDMQGRHGYDLLRHLTAWEQLAVTLLNQHQQGANLSTLPLSDEERSAFNRAALATTQTPEAAWRQWEAIRLAVREAVNGLTFEAMHRPLHTNGGNIFVSELIKRIIGHEQRHIRHLYAIHQQIHPYSATI